MPKDLMQMFNNIVELYVCIQPAGQATSITPAPSIETQPAALPTSITQAPSSETQPAAGGWCSL